MAVTLNINNKTFEEITIKTRIISLPDTVFLRGKVMILDREVEKIKISEWDSCSRGAAKRCLQAAKFKPLSTVRGVVEEKASRRGHQQEDHYRTLATCHYDFEKMLIKHSFGGLADRQTRACVPCNAAHARRGSDCGSSDRKWRLESRFLHAAEETLLSCYREKRCKMIR